MATKDELELNKFGVSPVTLPLICTYFSHLVHNKDWKTCQPLAFKTY